jgi:L-ascorbate metabolism protein UlaG (beta-lactamase superfamily)
VRRVAGRARAASAPRHIGCCSAPRPTAAQPGPSPPCRPRRQHFPLLPLDYAALAAPPADAVQAVWVGHATVLVQLEGFTFITDPVLSMRCSPVQFAGPIRVVPAALQAEDPQLPALDFVLLSHNHYDHLDYNSVRGLHKRHGGALRWYVPLGLKAWFAGVGVSNVIELDWWQVRGARGSRAGGRWWRRQGPALCVPAAPAAAPAACAADCRPRRARAAGGGAQPARRQQRAHRHDAGAALVRAGRAGPAADAVGRVRCDGPAAALLVRGRHRHVPRVPRDRREVRAEAATRLPARMPAALPAGRRPAGCRPSGPAGRLAARRQLQALHTAAEQAPGRGAKWAPCAALPRCRYGPFDLAAIPTGAYGPRWFMGPQHVDPKEAVQVGPLLLLLPACLPACLPCLPAFDCMTASFPCPGTPRSPARPPAFPTPPHPTPTPRQIHQEVRSRRSVAIHCSTFQLASEPLDEPPLLLVQEAAAAGLGPDEFVTLQHGGMIQTAQGRDLRAPPVMKV